MDLHREIIVEASAAETWEVLGARFGDIGTWATAIQASSLDGPLGVGAIRTCEIKGFGPIPDGAVRERLVHFDPSTRSFSYEVVEGLPSMLTSAMNRWRVDPLGPRRCRVTTHATVVPVWWLRPFSWLLRRQLTRDIGTFAEDLTHRIREGVPHPRKLAS